MREETKMTNREIAEANFRQYLMADFNHMMGRGKKPVPAFYGYSGGNTMEVNGEVFHTAELVKYTMPINAGF